MGSGFDLQQIMNEVSAGISPPPAPSPVSELDAFLMLDSLLAGLHKEYLDAKAMRCKSEKDFGADDAMTDMARLVEDSAWCAMQTRYMELRAERPLMAKAQAMMEEERAKHQRKQDEEKTREAMRQYDSLEMAERMRKESETLAAWFVMLLLSQAVSFRMYQPAHHFNRMAA